MNLAPIAIFVYNRPEHTRKTIEALLRNNLAKESELYVFCDGPLSTSSGQAMEKVNEVRKYLKTISGFKKIEIKEKEENAGLANSIISGVTEIVNKFGKVIVVEDDLVTSKFFLEYMNNALDLYQNDEKVISIHGYIYPTKETLPETFFIKGADCWGWATWKRGWSLFEPDGKKLLNELEQKDLIKEFDFGNSYGYSKMLQRQIEGKNNSWAIRWYASAFLKDKLTLYPGKSLVDNIGQDLSGTHSKKTNKFRVEVLDNKINLKRLPLEENVEARKIIGKYLKSLSSTNYKSKIKKVLKLIIPIKLVKLLKGKNKYGFFGNYSSWQEALDNCKGYDSPIILNKVKDSLLKVKNGEAAYERDSVLFDKIEASPITAHLSSIAEECGNKLTILDFGGSLGSSYFQNKDFLKNLTRPEWNIVEQENFVQVGKENFENKELKFWSSLDECLIKTYPDVAIFSSSIQYVEKPYDILNKIANKKIKYIIIERTSFFQNDLEKDKIVVQKVPPRIYDASYPCWVMSQSKLKTFFEQKDYQIVNEIISGKSTTVEDKGDIIEFKGFVFKRK